MPNPYEDPKTGTPYNRLKIDDKEELQLRETMAVSRRLMQLRRKPIEGNFDAEHLQAIHKHLLKDVYDWAGKFRTLPMRNSRSHVAFAEPEDIIPKLAQLSGLLKEQNFLAKTSKDEFAFKAAVVLSEINAVHGFPDGNGRTQRELIRTLGLQAGYKIDWNYNTENQKYQFNKASRLAHNDGNLTGLVHIMRSSISDQPLQASHNLRDQRNLANPAVLKENVTENAATVDAAARDRTARDLKLLAPYLPESRIPETATAHGDLRFWEVKEGNQTTKYAAGVLAHPDLSKTDRDLKAQSAVSRGTGFDAGHLIGHQFGGPEIPGNLSLQNPTMNQGGGNWYKMESQWAADLRQDNSIAVVVKEVTRTDQPNFLWRSVESLTIDPDGKVRHDEVSMLNPETDRALAAQGREPAPEIPGGAVLLDLKPALARQEEIGQQAEQAAQERLDNAKATETQPTGYKRVLTHLQNWRGQSKENTLAEGKEPEPVGTLGPPTEGKTPKEQRAEQEANERIAKLQKDRLIPQLDRMTSAIHPKTGDVTYSLSGKAAFVDRGKTISVLEPEAACTRIALEMAVQKYGRSIAATGTPAFQKQLADAAAQMKLDIAFIDPKIQAKFLQSKKELQEKEEKAHAALAALQNKAPAKAEAISPSQLRQTPEQSAQPKSVNQPETPVRDPERTFSKHADALQQRYGFGLDAAKADGIVALKMAQTGWQPEDVAAALKSRRLNTDLAPNDVPAYAEKLTVQAFGKAAREASIQRNNSMDIGR